jgi:ATP-dependent DNA ligase
MAKVSGHWARADFRWNRSWISRSANGYMADEITRSPVHTCGKVGDEPGYALRFPRVVGWARADKKPKDATTVQEIVSMVQLQKRVQLTE